MIENYKKYLEFLNDKLTTFFHKQKPYIQCKEGCAKCCQNAEFPFSQIEVIYLMNGVSKLDDETKNIVADNVKKIRNFTELACCYALPLVTFVDCLGIRPSLSVNDSPVLKEICEYLSLLDATDTAKIAVVTGSAVGLGYSLFAAKSAGFDYTFALATSRIALFDAAAGAQIEFFHEEKADKDKLLQRYAEETSDPVNAAKGGYLDTVVEPQFIKQYLIASLQMLLK